MNQNILIFIFGALFGIIIQYAKLNKYDVISGQALLKNNTVLKTILLAIGIGILLLNIIIALGWASFHIKPFVMGGIILGGLIFGSGMAILGYCPGTMAVSIGEGSLDAIIGLIGGLVGGLTFTILLPFIHPILGPNLGKISLYSLLNEHIAVYYITALLISGLIIFASFKINIGEGEKNNRWIISALGLAILNAVVFLKFTTNRPIGASTAYPYLADLLTNTTENSYFEKIRMPGHWEIIFLLGAMIAAFITALIKKDFRLKLIHDNWKRYKASSDLNRIIWAFVGGFLLIFGARMAGGCTSGHILSGGMQLAISSLTFAIFVFIGLIITGKIFYKK